MQQLKHFSHEHPLTLNRDRTQEGVENCCGCNETILIGDSAYSCSTRTHSDRSCYHFFLHKICAELPLKLDHPGHQDHLLTLHSHPQYPDRSCACDVCGVGDWKWFTYVCVSCSFDVCLRCVLQEFRFYEVQDRSFLQEAHNHALTLIPKKALFRCDACETEAKDLSYFCTSCQFWIHRNCATLESTLKCEFHGDHPLVLARSFPDQFSSFDQFCSICSKIVQKSCWIYYCANCRFFAHIKCATSRKTVDSLISRSSENDNTDDPNLARFPIPDETSASLLVHQFIKDISLADDSSKPANQINHWAHKDHALLLFDELNQGNGVIKYDEMLCDGCIQPLSVDVDAFYGCVKCNYFLHKFCAELPKELKHPSHPEHALLINQHSTRPQLFHCHFCGKPCNGIYYDCASCKFNIDIVCASLPSKIKHEFHKHPLDQLQILHKSTVSDAYTGDAFGFGCKDCGFYASKKAIQLPRTIKHRWDPHPLFLMNPPVKDHPHEFDCEMCSEYINPNYWFYHCRDCDLSFHILCLDLDDYFSNIKFGATIKFDSHQHSLTFVRSKMKGALCNSCNLFVYVDGPALECAPCKYLCCSFCIEEYFR